MMTKQELEAAIESCERATMSYQNCEKLATFYAIYDHLYTRRAPQIEQVTETKISVSDGSEFLNMINGLQSSKVWSIMNELMTSLQVIQPRLYDAVMQKIQDL